MQYDRRTLSSLGANMKSILFSILLFSFFPALADITQLIGGYENSGLALDITVNAEKQSITLNYYFVGESGNTTTEEFVVDGKDHMGVVPGQSYSANFTVDMLSVKQNYAGWTEVNEFQIVGKDLGVYRKINNVVIGSTLFIRVK